VLPSKGHTCRVSHLLAKAELASSCLRNCPELRVFCRLPRPPATPEARALRGTIAGGETTMRTAIAGTLVLSTAMLFPGAVVQTAPSRHSMRSRAHPVPSQAHPASERAPWCATSLFQPVRCCGCASTAASGRTFHESRIACLRRCRVPSYRRPDSAAGGQHGHGLRVGGNAAGKVKGPRQGRGALQSHRPASEGDTTAWTRGRGSPLRRRARRRTR
jgi:hypothetical protein